MTTQRLERTTVRCATAGRRLDHRVRVGGLVSSGAADGRVA